MKILQLNYILRKKMDDQYKHHLLKYKNKITIDLLKDIYSKNYILNKETGENIYFEDLKYYFLNKDVQAQKYCIGITNKNTKCNKKVHLNYDYCKTHVEKYKSKIINNVLLKYKNCYNSDVSIEFSENNNLKNINENHFNEKKLKKIFIDNSLYYCDDEFIYDKSVDNFYEKVGYIKNSEYILNFNPFEF